MHKPRYSEVFLFSSDFRILLSMKDIVFQLIKQCISGFAGENSELVFDVTYPKPEFGDFATNAALILSKKVPSVAPAGPKELAIKMVETLKKLDSGKYFDDIVAVNGFINFTVSKKHLAQNLAEIQSLGDSYGTSKLGQGKTVVVEYFQNNVAKPPHVGHLRSAVIGDTLVRIYRALGYTVISDTHIGDWGTQFGILLHAFKTMGNKAEVEQDPIHKLNDLYVAMRKKIEEHPEEYEQSKLEFKKLEDGDPENRGLWEWFVSESIKDFDRYCGLLRLEKFDYNLGESFYEDKMPQVLEELEIKGLVKSGDTGERYVDLEEYNMGRCILLKSDGATTYHLRDFATYIFRKKEWNFYKNYYVVDVRQSHHFKQLFKVLELLGYSAESDSMHVELGFMSLPSGAISTRSGNTISLKALLEEAEVRALAVINEKNPNLPRKEVISKQVAIAAIKYFDLSHNRKTEIEFTWEKAISFEGNTGPYLQYTHARIHGILKKANQELPETRSSNTEEFGGSESLVLRKLLQWNEILEMAGKDVFPSTICNYLFELASVFNGFYENVPVIKEVDSLKKNFRLELCRAVAQVIKNGLNILGIEAPEEM